mmetsp:Transcript_35948/g.54685  ORF Transcript_35948/g.54685 Transcript_35948/m.54685 type:complete len:179 (+) Transcript_35948:447-983(+)
MNPSVVYESLSTHIWRLHDPQNCITGSSKPIAVKIPTDQFPDPDLILRFQNEYKVSRHLSQCNVTRSVFKEQNQNGTYALYLEWVPGMTLKEWIRFAHKRNEQMSDTCENTTSDNIMSNFDFENAVILAREITKAVREIHDLGVVHNNVTTENIIVNTSEDDGSLSIKVIDLGLASQG